MHDQHDIQKKTGSKSTDTAETTPRPCLEHRRESNVPFLTQLAQGNTREHLDEGDEVVLISVRFLKRTLACATQDGRGGSIWPHLSFSLEK